MTLEERNLLVEKNMGLAHLIVNKFLKSNYDAGYGLTSKEDLLQIAYCSLIKAVDSFDSKRGYKFSTYATSIIRRDIWSTYIESKKTQESVSLNQLLDVQNQYEASTIGARNIADISLLNETISEDSKDSLIDFFIDYESALISIKEKKQRPQVYRLAEKIVLLRFLGYSRSQIAKKLDIPISAYESALIAIRKNLQPGKKTLFGT